MRNTRSKRNTQKSKKILMIFAYFAFSVVMAETKNKPLAQSLQLILVVTPDWNSHYAFLRRYERDKVGSRWQVVEPMIPVEVGRNGLAWGKGLHDEATISGGDGPIKKEGDGRSPAGIFALSSAFGYGKNIPKIKLPYVRAVTTLECVDDPQSTHYNQILDRKGINHPDWKSSERMLRDDELYRLGVIVDHNAKREPGRGSCIFLHIWSGLHKGTAGCTAMKSSNIEEVIVWLDPKKRPVLAQLPEDEYNKLRGVWGLP